MLRSVTRVETASLKKAVTEPSPIPADWIIAGMPQARAAQLSRSADGLATTMLWECSAGTFRWHFGDDETVHIVEGSVHVVWDDQEFELHAGDVAFFPAGTVAVWTIRTHLKKVAFCRIAAPLPVALAQRLYRRLAVMMGVGARSPVANAA